MHKCEKCGADMVEKDGKNGKFYACPNYPECKFTKNYTEVVKKTAQNGSNGQKAMYVSYAKDIFVKLADSIEPNESYKNIMDLSINLVKQAQEAF